MAPGGAVPALVLDATVSDVVLRDTVLTLIAGRLAPLMRRDLVAALDSERQILLEADLSDGALSPAVSRHSPQVVILAPSVDYGSLMGLKSHRPCPAVVVLAENPQALLGTMLLAAGVSCVASSALRSSMSRALTRAACGEAIFIAADGSYVTRALSIPAGLLSARETEILEQLSLERGYAAIAHDLKISPETVRKHTSSICKKLSVKTRFQLPRVLPRPLPVVTSLEHK